MTHRFSIIASALLLCAAAASGSDGPAVSASHVWIRTAPAGVQVLSGFLTLENLTDKPLHIVSVTSPDFASVAIGSSAVADQPQKPSEPATVTLKPHQPVALKPDTDHLLLLQPHKRLFDGDMVTLIFNFSDGSSLDLLVPVRSQSPEN